MKRENFAIIIAIIVALVVDILMFMHFNKQDESNIDENQLYVEVFDNIYFKFQRYDYALGQKMVVGVEKSLDKGKTYQKVSEDYVVVSNDSKFKFLNKNQAIIISQNMLSRENDFLGMKVSNNGGISFADAKFEYQNDKVDVLNIMDFPYVEGNRLKLDCLVYVLNEEGYHELIVPFFSDDGGLNWHL